MGERKYDVVALGELLVDYTYCGENERGNMMMEANPGGAPCNVLAMLHNLHFKTAFIGQVGDDMFGDMLEKRAEEAGIDMSGLVKSDRFQTTLAFVKNDPNGDRDFSFYRREGADAMLDKSCIREDIIREAKVFHFGSLSMTDKCGEEATKYAVLLAKEAGCIISFDPNYRPALWEDESRAREMIAWGIDNCDILKISDDEVTFMTGESDIEKGAKILKNKYDVPMLFATLGADGSMAFFGDVYARVGGFKNNKTIETTGAGDTFCACALGYILRMARVTGAIEQGGGTLFGHSTDWNRDDVFVGLDEYHLSDLLTYSNAAASIITTRKGALSVMPTRDEITSFIVNNLE